jgi:hypothetical protein
VEGPGLAGSNRATTSLGEHEHEESGVS